MSATEDSRLSDEQIARSYLDLVPSTVRTVDIDLTTPDRPQTAFAGNDGARFAEVAVLLPCRNEAPTIGRVVSDFRSALPGAAVYVYDNASSDDTADVAHRAGAVVRSAPVPGKGNVLRRMFAEIEACVYVVADGDDTYDAAASPALVEQLQSERLDMVVATRTETESSGQTYRRGHRAGNRLLTRSVHWLFGDGSADMLSGYRVLSRRYVKSFPASSRGFETETEMTVHALDLSLPFAERPAPYRERPAESTSKLRTVPDGIRILKFIVLLCKDYRPLRFFGALAVAAASASALALALGRGLNGWSPPTVVAGILAGLCVVCMLVGLILDSLGRSRREMKRILYLAVPHAPPGPDLGRAAVATMRRG